MGSRTNASSSSSFNFGGGGEEEDEKIYFVGETMPAMQSGGGASAGAVYGSRASTTSSPSKRPGPGNNAASSSSQGQQPIGRCQVEGCGVDLSGAKAYYCKHRVCGPHSKAPRVVVGGIEQRFCQQCSRFHLLSEFDQGKRSCRRRLAGHNERRRKPPSGPLSHARQFSPFFHEVDASGSSGFVMDFTRPSTTVPLIVSSQPRQVIPNRPHIGSQPFVRTPTNHQLLPNPNETLNLVGAPNSSSARSLLSSPVQWGRPATGDSFPDPFNFTHLHAGTSNSPGGHGYNASASLVHAEHHVGLDMMERPVTETVRYSGQLGSGSGSGSALHGNSGSMNDNDDRNYEHGVDGGGSSHDLIQWSL